LSDEVSARQIKPSSWVRKDLFPRSAFHAADAEQVLNVCRGPNARQSVLELFTSHQPGSKQADDH